jgi:hypothetical protein
MISSVLGVLVLIPATLDGGGRNRVGVSSLSVLDWSPIPVFVGLYETLRGAAGTSFRDALVPLEWTLAAASAAILAAVASYRRQFQHVLSPPASAGAGLAAWSIRAVARLLVPRDRLARAIAEFVLATVSRNRAQQTPIAINCAIPMVLVMLSVASVRGGFPALMQPRTIVLWIPLLAAYWMTIGLRAACFVPAELPAAWTFEANAPPTTRSYWRGTRAAMVALIVSSSALIAMLVTTPLLGWRIAAWHAAYVSLVATTVIDLVLLTLRHIPFTRPYPPGHAKLKATWPLYLFGMFAAAYWPVRAELRALGGGELMLLGSAAGVCVAAYFAGLASASRWSVEARDDGSESRDDVATLAIGFSGFSPGSPARSR